MKHQCFNMSLYTFHSFTIKKAIESEQKQLKGGILSLWRYINSVYV